ncbi:MAG: universal stress protein [Deltaproteobacteria bacterium]|nr:MAG: universal stress protein [Deltaproteobacteria bacterium]
MQTVPYRKVMLATDLTSTALTPWAHALKLSCRPGAELTVLHVRQKDQRSRWAKLPTARDMLVQWGVLDRDATVHDFRRLGFHLFLHSLESEDTSSGIETGLEAIGPELVVLGTRRPTGLDRFLNGSVSERIARQAPHAALVVPERTRPIVDPRTGDIGYPRVLVPLSSDADQVHAVEEAIRFAETLSDGPVEFVLLHVGPRGALPTLKLPRRGRWSWRTVYREGAVVDQIVDVARQLDCAAISMVTRGHDSMLDVFRGSRTERVLRHAPCPVLIRPLAA